MRNILTPKQRLDRDRLRKQNYRVALRTRGFNQRTVWATPEARQKLSAVARDLGPGLVLKNSKRPAETIREMWPVNQDAGNANVPAHSSDANGGRIET